jgi:voltage-dependent calcium channel
VSGFIFNAAEYRTGDGTRSFWKVIVDNYSAIFAPQRQASIRASGVGTAFSAPQLFRSFTGKQGEGIQSVEQAQRLQLARRAFMRHSFNRLDLIAVVSFWISFILGILGIESTYHLYVFRMMSCLRILRLLAITHGTSVCIHLATHDAMLI